MLYLRVSLLLSLIHRSSSRTQLLLLPPLSLCYHARPAAATPQRPPKQTMSASSPPPPIPPTTPPLEEVHNFFEQVGGALLAMLGVTITVIGLHGMKVHGAVGSARCCSKPWRWSAYGGLWATGQLIQLLAVKLALEPVVTAVSNFAIIVNAYLASRMLGESIGKVDVVSVVVMILGACLVVAFTPQPAFRTLSIAGLAHLWSSSPLPTVGIIVTTLFAAAALPRAVLSCTRPRTYAGYSVGGVAFGLLAGYTGATSVTCASLDWLLFDNYGLVALLSGDAAGAAVALGFGAFAGEVGMVVALFFGMAHHEASVVVSTYYITMTVFGAVQGLFTMQTIGDLDAISGTCFALGVLLCLAAVSTMAFLRSGRGASAAHGATTATPPAPIVADAGARLLTIGPS